MRSCFVVLDQAGHICQLYEEERLAKRAVEVSYSRLDVEVTQEKDTVTVKFKDGKDPHTYTIRAEHIYDYAEHL